MAHPQNSPRGLFYKQNLGITDGGKFYMDGFAKSTGILYGTEVGLVTAGSGVKFSSPSSAIPSSVDRGASIHMVTNSTGYAALAVNTSATRWKYFAVTGVLRTCSVTK